MAKERRPTLEVRPPKDADRFVLGSPATGNRQPLETPPMPQPVAAAPPASPPQPVPAVLPEMQPEKRKRGRPRKRPRSGPAARKPGRVVRADGTELCQITIYLDAKTGAKFRLYCFENGLKMSEIAGQVVAEHVNNKL